MSKIGRLDPRTVEMLNECVENLPESKEGKLSTRELAAIMSKDFPISKSHIHRILSAHAQPSVEMATNFAVFFHVPFGVLWQHENLEVVRRTT